MKKCILISKALIGDLQTRAVEGLPNEAGGFLIGSRTKMGMIVTKATGPYQKDVSSKTRFKRIDKRHRTNILITWRLSGTKETLLGDWHSHTSSNLGYSETDREGWTELISKNQSPMIGLIVNSDSIQMYCLSLSHRLKIEVAQHLIENNTNILYEFNE